MFFFRLSFFWSLFLKESPICGFLFAGEKSPAANPKITRKKKLLAPKPLNKFVFEGKKNFGEGGWGKMSV